jgi:membrane protein
MSDAITEKLESVLWDPRVESLPLVARYSVQTLRFIYAILRDMVAGNITLRAMGLVYITILSVVPAIAIVFSILKGFGFHRRLEPLLENFLLPLGEKGVELTHQIMGFVENVQGNVLAGIGLVMLFVTTMSMAQKVEDSFNYVWRVEQPRGIAQRLSEYLSLILIIPVVMITAVTLIASVESNEYVQEFAGFQPIGTTLLLFGKLAPYFLVILGFSFVYWFLPNTPVNFSAAFMGGLTGGMLWAATGFLFAAFVATSARTLSIYATFAIVILALIWIYLCWLILLVGALVSFYVQNPERLRLGYRPISLGGRQREQIAMSIMTMSAEAFRNGTKPPTLIDVANSLDLPNMLLSPVARRLSAAGLLTRTTKNELYPQRDPGRIEVKSIIDAVREPQKIDVFPEGRWPQPVIDVNDRLEAAMSDALGQRSIYDVIDNGKPDNSETAD